MRALTRRLAAVVNRTDAGNGVPFASPVAMTPRADGRWFSWTHYGVMAPGLPEPHRWFGVMAILGTTGVRCFDDDARIRTTPRDTAYVVSGTATAGAGAARSWSLAEECELRPDGSRLSFGDDELVLAGLPPRVRVTRAGEDRVELELEVTDKVAVFSRIPGVYDHWSLLARYSGTVGAQAVAGLCTYEYARGAGPHSVTAHRLPGWAKVQIRSFTYQVLNLDGETQLLLTRAGPHGDLPVHEGAWERGLHDHGAMHRDVACTVTERRSAPLRTPDGRTMTLAARWRWTVRDDAGREVAELDCRARDDWTYGLGAGYVGSFAWSGRHRGRAVEGSGYVEAIEV